MRIVFMGTPDFAAAHLEALIRGGYEVCGVFTQPDKPRDRGMKLSFSPVKEIAVANGIPVFQPRTLRDGEALSQLRALAPELVVVVAYGKILPDEIIEAPARGTINVHASLLPQYRGSAPVQWSVLNGDRETGVTTIYVASEVDSGDIIYQDATEIGEFETSGELFVRLRDMGARLLCRTIDAIADGTAPRIPQDASQATFTVQLNKGMSPIDWTKGPRQIVKWVYGLQPWPGATAELGGVTLKVLGAAYTETETAAEPGVVVAAGKAGLEVACGGGKTLLLTEVQAPGGKRMPAASYLLGHPFDTEGQKWA